MTVNVAALTTTPAAVSLRSSRPVAILDNCHRPMPVSTTMPVPWLVTVMSPVRTPGDASAAPCSSVSGTARAPAGASIWVSRSSQRIEPSGHRSVTVTSAGKRSLVRVVVDADGGVDLDAVADVSRAVSDALDGGDAFAGPFVLEVSSPGVDRPLTEPRHWRRAVGRLVAVPVGEQTLTGRVVEAGDTGVVLDVDGARHAVGWAELGAGKVQIEFNRTAGED